MERITKLLTVNPYSRPVETPKHRFVGVKFISYHWYEKPKQTANAVWQYFEGRKDGLHGYGSANYIIDPDVIIQAIPDDEFCYDVTSSYYTPEALRLFSPVPAWYGISIEMAHDNWDGKLNDKTQYNAMVKGAELCMKYKLDPFTDCLRHWDVTYKCTSRGPCPRWFVEHPDDWMKFRIATEEYMIYVAERRGGVSV